jgi:hypothetical protein
MTAPHHRKGAKASRCRAVVFFFVVAAVVVVVVRINSPFLPFGYKCASWYSTFQEFA